MKVVTIVIVIVIGAGCLIVSSAAAQQRGITISRKDSFTYRDRSAENFGYVGAGLTAFLALLDSGTGARQGGVPVPGYPSYPVPGPGGAWGSGGVVVIPAPVIVDGAVICADPSWCTWPLPLGPGPGADGFTAGVRAGPAIARERRIIGAIIYHQNYAAGLDAGAAQYGR